MRRAILIVVVGLAAHLSYFAFDRDSVARDTKKYVEPADSMLAGRGFTRAGVPETLRTPGYPVVLAALRALHLDLRQIVFLQHLASALAAAAWFFLVRRATRNEFIATFSALFLAIDLPVIHHANLILTETLFMILAMVFFAIIWRLTEGDVSRAWAAAGAGLLLGAMILVRPLTQLFFIPMAAYLSWVRRDVARRIVPLFIIGALIPPIPWMLRNHRVGGLATLSTNSAILMLHFHAPAALAIDDPGDFDTNFERRQKEVRALADERIRKELGIADVSRVPYIFRARSDSRLGREIVRAHPVAFAKVFALGIGANLLGGSADALTRVTPLSRFEANAVLLPYTALALALALVGQIWLLRTNRRLGVLVLLFVGYFVVVSAGQISYSRFRVPVVPMYAIAVAAGVHALRERLFRRPA